MSISLMRATSLTCVFGAWTLVTHVGWIRPIFLPSPSAVFFALWKLLSDGRFLQALGASFTRVALATIISVFLGSVLGVAMGVSRRWEALLSPFTQALRYLPITALLPLLILWFGIGETMKIVFLVTGITFYFIPLVQNGIRSTPREFVEVAKAFGASGWTMIRRVFWPHALPQIFDGLIIINGIGWTYVVLAEMINARNGLGYLINIAGRLQRSDEVFAGLILIAMVAIMSDRLLRRLRLKYFFW